MRLTYLILLLLSLDSVSRADRDKIRLEMKRLEEINSMKYINMNATVITSANFKKISSGFCGFFMPIHRLGSNLNEKCESLLSMTLFSRRIQFINDIYKEINQSLLNYNQLDKPFEDVTLFTLESIFLSIQQDNETAVNICVFGKPSLRILLFYLTINAMNNNLFILVEPTDLNSMKLYNEFNIWAKSHEFQSRITVVININEFAYLNGFQICNIFHVFSSDKNLSDLTQKLDLVGVYHVWNSYILIEIPFENSHLQFQNILNNSTILFHENTKWLSTSLIPGSDELSYHVDSQGFTNVLFETSKKISTLSLLAFGKLQSSLSVRNQDVVMKGLSKVSDVIQQQQHDTHNIYLNIYITSTSRLFYENAYGLLNAISSLQFDSISNINSDGYKVSYNVIVTAKVTGFSPLSHVIHPTNSIDNRNILELQISFGCHTPSIYLKHYICYQTEQPWSYIYHKDSNTHNYISQNYMLNAVSVFAMSQYHKHLLLERGIFNVYVVPFYTYNGRNHTDNHDIDLTSYTSQSNRNHAENINEDVVNLFTYFSLPNSSIGTNFTNTSNQSTYLYDVLIYGSCTKRRQELITILENYGKTFNYRIKSLCVNSWSESILDEELETLILGSRVIINNHSFENSSLQTHRLNYIFSFSKCVISEKSMVDSELDMGYQQAAIMVNNYDEMITELNYILENHDLQKQCELKAYIKYKTIQKDTLQLKQALESFFITNHAL